jgi:hypothetical protein
MSVKEYIKQTDKGLICSHPQVAKFWQWGGGPANGPFDHYVSISLSSGPDVEFKATETVDAVEQCNNFLNTIPE